MTAVATDRNLASNPLWRRAQTHLVRGELGAAREELATMRAADGSGPAAHLVAAQIAWREGRVRDGTRHALDSAQIASEDPDDLCTVADVALEVGETVAARARLDRVQLDACEAPLLLMRLTVLGKKLGAYFGDACAYSYNIDALAKYFGDYRRVMTHWDETMPGAILDVPYTDLVRNPGATPHKVFAFCGRDWNRTA